MRTKLISKIALALSFMLAITFTFSCSGDDNVGSGGNLFSYCLISGQCLDGPFASKECGDLGGLPSNSCPGVSGNILVDNRDGKTAIGSASEVEDYSNYAYCRIMRNFSEDAHWGIDPKSSMFSSVRCIKD